MLPLVRFRTRVEGAGGLVLSRVGAPWSRHCNRWPRGSGQPVTVSLPPRHCCAPPKRKTTLRKLAISTWPRAGTAWRRTWNLGWTDGVACTELRGDQSAPPPDEQCPAPFLLRSVVVQHVGVCCFSGRMMRDHMILNRSVRRHRKDSAAHQLVLALVRPALNDFPRHHRAYSLQVLQIHFGSRVQIQHFVGDGLRWGGGDPQHWRGGCQRD